MSDPMKNAWDDVAESFSALGRAMKERYAAATTPEEDAAAEAEGASHASDPTAALREAFEQLLAAGQEFGDRATALVRDDDVKAQAQARRHVAERRARSDRRPDRPGGPWLRSRAPATTTPSTPTSIADVAGDITDAEPPGTTPVPGLTVRPSVRPWT